MGRRDPELRGDARRGPARARVHWSRPVSDALRQPTADALGLHERASATPARGLVERPHLPGQAPSWTERTLTLRTQQEWFLAIVSTPESERAPVDEQSAPRLVTPSKSLSSLERIE